jgi:transcription elongation factor Elf1
MVHFTANFEAHNRPPTPPVCPKCGSHRTEVIGKADDTTIRTVRCNACGAISSVPRSETAMFIPEETTSAPSAA